MRQVAPYSVKGFIYLSIYIYVCDNSKIWSRQVGPEGAAETKTNHETNHEHAEPQR